MAIIPQVITEDRASGAQVVDGSLRFDADKKSHLTKTFFDGDRRKYTWSGWVKRSRTSSGGEVLFTGYRTSSGGTYLCFGGGSVSGTTADSLTFFSSPSGISVASTPVFRDLSAWYHIVLVVDTTQATSSNRVKFYVNGVETAYTTTTYPTQNLQTAINNNSNPHYLGVSQTADSLHFSGQLSDVHFIDGQALDASYFGYTDPLTGTWRPQKFSGSFDSTRTESATLNTSFATSPPTDSTGNTTLTTQNISTQTASTNSFGVTTSTLFSGGSQYSRVLTDASVGSSIPFTIDFIAKFVQSGSSSYFCQLGSGNAIIQTQNPASSTTCLLWGVVEFTMSYGWHSVRVQWDGTRTKLWVDGNLTLNVTNPPGASSGNLAIGAHPTLDVRTFNGEFGPFRLTHGVLGAPRSGGLVASDFTNSTTLDNPNSFYLPFDENSPIGKNKARISVPTPNDGRIWSSLLTPASGSLDQSPALAFNGTIDGTDPNRLRTSDDYTLVTMDLSSAPVGVSSHVKVYAQTSYDSTCTVTISGTTYTSSSGSRHTFNQPGTLTQMTLRTNSVSGRTYMEGMAIDGIILIDGVDNSSWTPVNFGGSNTIDKSTGALPILNTDGGGKTARIGVRDDVSPETPDVIQGAVSFDGTDDVIQVSDTNLISTTDFTVECFVYTTERSSGSNQTFVEFNTGTRWIFGMKGSTNYMYFWRGSEYISAKAVTPGTWNHVAWVKSGTTLKQYLNGVEVQSQTGLVGSFTSDLISIGRNNDGTEDFQGFISNVRVVESALYTTDFTPPTVQLTAVANTKLLCCQSPDSASTAAASPNISGINDGTGWSGYMSTSGTLQVENSFPLAFDGSTSTNVRMNTGNGTMTYSGPSFTVSSQLRMYLYQGNGGTGSVSVNGVDQGVSFAAEQWYTIGSFTGTVNTFTITASANQGTQLYAVEVDGVVLVDPVSPLYNTHATRSEVSGSNVLALPLVGVTTDLSSLVRGGGSSKTISSVNAVASYAQGNFYGGSYYFDGTGDYVTASSSSDFTFGTGDFTIEGWVYPANSDTNNKSIFSTNWGASGSILITYDHVTNKGFDLFDYTTSSGTPIISTSGIYEPNTWHHIAVVRSSGTTKIYINGNQVANGRHTSNLTRDVFVIGAVYTNGTETWNGYIQDVRVYKGVAKYTSNFIPASTDPDIVPDSPSGVSYRSNLALPPSIDGGAVAFDGTDDYLELTSSDVAVGSGDFTIECFVNLTVRSADNHNIFSYRGAGGSATGFNLAVLETSRGLALYSDGSIFSAGIVPAYKWCHIAISRTNGVLKGFIDGLEIASVSNTTNFSNTTLTIGSANGGAQSDAQGFISNFRMIKGTGLYKSNFTPPSSPLTSITNTKLLCCQSNTIAGAASISPNISGVNDGTVWSYYASGFTGAGYTVNKLFDNDTTNTSQVTTSASFTFTPPTPISYSSSIVVKVNTGSGSPMGFNVNGAGFGSYTLYNGAQEVTVVSGSGTLTSLSIAVNAGGGADFYYIKVDGVVLTDPISANGNATATKLNPFTVDIDTVRGNQSGYATLNPLDKGPNVTLSNGNLNTANSAGVNDLIKATIGMTSGKWYAEFQVTAQNSGAASPRIGLAPASSPVKSDDFGNSANEYAFALTNNSTYYGRVYNNSGWNGTATAVENNSIGMIAFDANTGGMWFGVNGIWFNNGNPNAGTNAWFTAAMSEPYFFTVHNVSGSSVVSNFGQKPFKYAPPEGFLPLNAANTSTTKILDVKLDRTYSTSSTYSNSNLSVLTPSSTGTVRANDGMGKGKWYAECVWTAGSSGAVIGITQGRHVTTNNVGQGAYGYGYYSAGSFQNNGGDAGSPASYVVGDVIGVAYDGDNGTLTFYKNGASQGQAFSGLTAYPYYFSVSDGSSEGTGNFTWRFKESQFTQSIPSGYSAFDQNNRTSTSIISRPDQNFNSILFTGNGTSQSITVGFKPDLVWIKDRSSTNNYSHRIADSVRGSTRVLFSDNASQEQVNQYGTIDKFTAQGFDLRQGSNSNGDGSNTSGSDMVAWCWKAGGSGGGYSFWKDDVGYSTAAAAGLNGGSITPTGASIGTKQGFSIITYTANLAEGGATISHGLGRKPAFAIFKNRDSTLGTNEVDWGVYHQSIGATKKLELNQTLAEGTFDGPFNNTEPTSSLFCFGGRSGGSIQGHSYLTNGPANDGFVGYIWTEIPGFSKFGSYVGNGTQSDGSFVWLGFRPRWIMIKGISTDSWIMHDAARNPTNYVGKRLWANLADKEATSSTFGVDFLSNGFKPRVSDADQGGWNTSGQTYVYAAWAEAPSINLYGGQSNAR